MDIEQVQEKVFQQMQANASGAASDEVRLTWKEARVLLLEIDHQRKCAQEWFAQAQRFAPPEPVEDRKVYVTVAGLTGVGKSAILGEIEIALKAIGAAVATDGAFQSEKNMTGADWAHYLEMYNPTVVLREINISVKP